MDMKHPWLTLLIIHILFNLTIFLLVNKEIIREERKNAEKDMKRMKKKVGHKKYFINPLKWKIAHP